MSGRAPARIGWTRDDLWFMLLEAQVDSILNLRQT